MDTQNEIISANLKRLMAQKGVQQNQVAAAIGVSAPTFNQYVKGVICPRMNKVQKIADYFGVTVAEVINAQITTTDEEHLLILFNKMSAEGKARLIEQAEFLAERFSK